MSGSRGRFVTLEGVEGCGKTTQLRRLAARLRRAGLDPCVTREPGGTPLGRALRRLLLDPAAPAVSPDAELLLYAADRAQHLREVVLPALERGRIVLSDRYLDATLAYQGHGRGVSLDAIVALHARPPLDLRPERTVLLDLEPSVALARARRRDLEADGPDEGRFEAEALAFHERVRRGYLALAEAEPERIAVIDAAGDAEAVERRVVAALVTTIPALDAVAP